MLSPATNETDRAIGRRIAAIRVGLGLTQRHVAEAIGVSHQRMSLYEGGRGRILASRLGLIAAALNVPVAALIADHHPDADADGPALLAIPGAPELLRAYADIGDPAGRIAALRIVQSGVSRPATMGVHGQ